MKVLISIETEGLEEKIFSTTTSRYTTKIRESNCKVFNSLASPEGAGGIFYLATVSQNTQKSHC